MLLLSAPFDAARAGRAAPIAAPCALVAGAALLGAAAGLGFELRGGGPPGLGRSAAAASLHAAFFAVGWILATDGRPGWPRPALSMAAALLVASVASRLSPWGAAGFLIVPVALVVVSRPHPELRRIGFGQATGLLQLTAGLGIGIFLGAHLLVSSSLTFGYGVRVADASVYLSAVAYDVGANALTAEWLFRGALFSRWWRRWRFWPAAALATALGVVRYLLDPALPSAVEVRAGAVFYMSLLGLGCCALRAWSGSLLPGYVATVVFFAAYRLLWP